MRTIIKIVLLGVIMSTVSIAHAAPDLEAYGRLEQVSDVSISPNGELIAYRRTESDKKDFVVVYSLIEKKIVNALDVKKIDPQGINFANNDHLILIVSEHVDWRGYRDSFDISTAFSLDLKTNKVEQLIKPGEVIGAKRSVRQGQTSLGRILAKSPDGKKLYMPAYVSKSSQDSDYDYSLLEVDVRGKAEHRVMTKGTRHTINYFMDGNGNLLARENLNSGSNKHSIDVYENEKWRPLYSYESAIATHNFVGVNDDFSALVFFRNDDNEDYLQLSLKDGNVKPLEGMTLSRDTSGTITDGDGVVMGVKYAGLLPDYSLSDTKLHKRVQSIMSFFKDHSVHLSAWTDDHKHIVVRAEGTQFAGDYFLFSEGKDPRFLVSSRLDIDSKEINPIVTSEFKARDGLMIPMILTLPKLTGGGIKNLPAVVLPHGGPESQDQVGFDYMAQALASRGFLVIQPQFRGSTGFGQEHLEAGWGQWGKGMQNDLTDVVGTLSQQGIIDSNRVCIVGASYGGYAALAGAAFTPDLYKCAVSIAGVSHLPKMLADDKSRYGRQSSVLDYWNRSILNGDYDKDALELISPYYSADKIKIPVLLLHGADDKIVEYEQSKLMSKAMKKAKGDVRLVKLKNDDHYLQDGATRTQAVKEMVTFVEKHIGT